MGGYHATLVPGAVFWAGSTEGPLVPPGNYTVRLTAGDQTFSQPFEIRKDPRFRAILKQFRSK